MMAWDTIAEEYIESFVNGNRKTVIHDLVNDWNQAEAVALSARIAAGMPESYRESFLHMTAHYGEE